MPLYCMEAEITQFACDAVVCAADPLLSAQKKISDGHAVRIRNKTSGTELTVPFRSEHLILTVLPKWQSGKSGELSVLTACCQEILKAAGHRRKIALRLSDIVPDYPVKSAESTVTAAFLNSPLLNDNDVYLLRDKKTADREQEEQLGVYLRQHYDPNAKKAGLIESYLKQKYMQKPSFIGVTGALLPETDPELARQLQNLGESFSETLFRFIDHAQISDAECYTRAGVSKQVFSKIRSKKNYHPKIETVLSLAIGLKLSISDTNELLQSAGYAFSPGSRRDKIVEFFIRQGNYNLFRINEVLFRNGEPLLGSE